MKMKFCLIFFHIDGWCLGETNRQEKHYSRKKAWKGHCEIKRIQLSLVADEWSF